MSDAPASPGLSVTSPSLTDILEQGGATFRGPVPRSTFETESTVFLPAFAAWLVGVESTKWNFIAKTSSDSLEVFWRLLSAGHYGGHFTPRSLILTSIVRSEPCQLAGEETGSESILLYQGHRPASGPALCLLSPHLLPTLPF